MSLLPTIQQHIVEREHPDSICISSLGNVYKHRNWKFVLVSTHRVIFFVWVEEAQDFHLIPTACFLYSEKKKRETWR